MRTGGAGRPQDGNLERARSLRVARAVLPWVIASGATLLLTRELSPPRDPIVIPSEPSAQPPENQKEKRQEKEEVVYEPWEQVCI